MSPGPLPGSQFTHFAYNPNIAANALYIAIFSVCFIGQVVQGVKYRTWQFMGPMLVGTLLEVVGYTARIFMHQDPSDRRWFLLDNITLILGPAFLTVSVYLCMGHLVRLYGAHISALKPRTYFVLFAACDVVNLVLQGIGGGLCSTEQDPVGIQAGINIVIAGLATQVASLLLFIACCVHFGINVLRHPEKQLERFRHVRESTTFRLFLFGLGLVVTCIFTRSMFRMIELWQGFTGPLANNEIYFMVLEGAMTIIVTLTLTMFHPGRCFCGCWQLPSDSSLTEVYAEDLKILDPTTKQAFSSRCSSLTLKGSTYQG